MVSPRPRLLGCGNLHGWGATELIIKPCALAARTCCTFSPYHTYTFSSVQFSFRLTHSHFPGPTLAHLLGRWGTYACAQCLPSGIVPIRSWTRTLRPPGIRPRHLPYHTIPYLSANPFTILGYAPPAHCNFHPFLSQYEYTHTHSHTHTEKTTTEVDDAATRHHTCILKLFYLPVLGFG